MQYWRPSRPCSYCTQFTARRRNAPGSDQISLSVEARINRIPLSDREISGFCFLVRLQDLHHLLQPAEFLGFLGELASVVPAWSTAENRSGERTRTRARTEKNGMIRARMGPKVI